MAEMANHLFSAACLLMIGMRNDVAKTALSGSEREIVGK
jgi:hypothetical protein